MVIKIAFLGDICLAHKALIEKSWSELGENHNAVNKFLRDVDFSLGTLENPLFGCEETRNKKKLALHSSPKTISFLKYLKVHAVTLANNHIADYGDEGGLATIELLEREGIKWFGAGYAGSEGNPTILNWNGISLACIGYSHPPCEAILSTPQNFGSAQYSRKDLENLIADLRGKVDHILVFMHWGMEDINYPVPENVKTAHEIIELGVDVIIGGHPHMYQGYEIYNGKYIFYSLGNCVFGDIVDVPCRENKTFTKIQTLRNRIGLVPVLAMDKSDIKLAGIRFVYFKKNNTLTMLTGLQAWLNLLYLNRISSKLIKKTSRSVDDYERWWKKNIKNLASLIYIERAVTKGTIFKPKAQYFNFLKRMFRQNIDDLQTGHWKE